VTSTAAAFAAVYIALFAAHQIGDYWLQTHAQAFDKGVPGWSGRLADARHVLALTATKTVVLGAVWALLHLGLHPWAVAAGLGADAASHWWADRKTTLRKLAQLMDRALPAFGKEAFYNLGAPRPGRDDNPTMGTGAAHLDQAWHLAWLLVAALIAVR
jgi:hypothetical protein